MYVSQNITTDKLDRISAAIFYNRFEVGEFIMAVGIEIKK